MSSLTKGQAIRNAIEAELAASRFYRLLAESTHDATAREFLTQMTAAEVAHAEAILQRSQGLTQGEGVAANADTNVDVIETVPNWKFVDDISFDDALSIAKSAELQAALYYDALADGLSDELQSFFRELAREEERHARLLEEHRAPLPE